jgi:polysaccharide biosynthesis transport protein
MIDNQNHIIRTGPGQMSVGQFGQSSIERRLVGHQQLSIVEVWSTLTKRKFSITIFALLIFAGAAAYTFLKTPQYEGVARLQIDPSRSSSLGLDESEKSASTDNDSRIKTEVTIIESDAVAKRVMNALQLFSNKAFAGKYTVAGNIKDFDQLNASQRRRLLERFAAALTVKVLPNTQVVEIRFRSADPIVATESANTIIDEYMQRNFHTRVDGTTQLSQWLSKQMEEIQASTTAAQRQFAEFQKEHNLLGTDENDNVVTNRLKQLNEELTQAEADRIVKEGRYKMAKTGNPVLVDSPVPNTTLQVLRTQQAELQAQLAQLSAQFGSGYPKIKELQSQLTDVNAAIEREGANIGTRLSNEYNAAATAENMIRKEFDSQKEEAFKLNENVAQYANLKHQIESGQQLYDALQLKVKEANVTSGLNSTYINVVDRAELPDKPVEPKKALYLSLGLGGGLFCGVLFGLMVDSFDDTLRTSDEVESVIVLPELGSIPFVPTLASKKRPALKNKSGAPNLLGLPGFDLTSIPVLKPNCAAAEAYRSLASVVLLSCVDHPPKVVVVTSAMAGEGKSTVSCNLAAALAQRGRRVLLVDADLRSAGIQEQLGMRPGRNTVFATGAAQYSRYQPIQALPNLHVVPTGFRPTDPHEVLDTARVKQLMEAWSAEYDHVIIDTPPVLLFADVLVMAARADGVIFVTRSGKSRIKASARAREVLTRAGANMLGFVLNSTKRREYYYQYPAEYKRLMSESAETTKTAEASHFRAR